VLFRSIPLIHGPDGAKLSKRHGALGVEAYRDMGYLPAAMRNYLLRLGWSHGDEEIISTAQAIEWFDLDAVGKSAARFDFAKLDSLNGHYIREADDADLIPLLGKAIEAEHGTAPDADALARLERGLPGLKSRAKTIKELAENGSFYTANRPLVLTEKATKILAHEARERLARLLPRLEAAPDWSEAALEELVRDFAEIDGAKLGQVAQPLRVALTGSTTSPGIFEVMAALDRAEALARIADQAK
jgi:glutamyl-tRNA synthetase